MPKDYSLQFSSILITLKNINDHLKDLDDRLVEIIKKLNQSQTDGEKTFKHLVIVKKSEKEKGGK
jgi:hypothetical protein